MAEWSSFEPVLLDLRDSTDYAVLVAALHDYASQLEEENSQSEAEALFHDYPVDGEAAAERRDGAERLRRLIDDIERQLDANSEARKNVRDGK